MADAVTALETEWAVFMENKPGPRGGWTQDQKWRADNPREFQSLLAYRAGGPLPVVASEPGRRMAAHLVAWRLLTDAPDPEPVVFGTRLAPWPVLTLPSAPTFTVSTSSALLAAADTDDRTIVIDGLLQVPVDWKPRGRGIVLTAKRFQVDGITGGSLKLNGTDQQVHGLRITDGVYDGVKIGDGARATRIVVADCLIEDINGQGVLTGGSGVTDFWVARNLMRNLGRGTDTFPHDDPRIGHGVYTAGPCVNGWIHANDIDSNSYGVQGYPDPGKLVVTGNVFRRSRLRSAMVLAGSGEKRIVGNLALDVDSLLTVYASAANAVCNDNVVLAPAPVKTPGYSTPQGARNASLSQAEIDAFRVEDVDWLPPYTRTGTRTEATVGA